MIWKGNVERRIYCEKIKEDSGSVVGIEPCSHPISGGGGKTAKADTETKTSITSSKLSFTYEKTGQDATTFTFCDTEVADFNGNGEYEIENAGSYTADGYEKLGDFASDTEYILENVVLTINGTYEFVLKDTGYTWSDNGVYRLDLGNIYYQAESISYNSKDGKATLKYDGSRISLYVAEEANNPVPVETKTSITSSKVSFTYEKTGQDATTFTFCDTEVADFNGNGEYNIENAGSYTADGYEKLGDFASDTEYILKNVVLTVNGKYEFVLKDTGYTWSDNGVYRLDLGNIYYQAESISYDSKDGKATLKYDGSRISLYVAEEANNPVPVETKTSITSSKVSFTYEKTGQDATTFTFCDTEVADFNGNGEYNIENAGSYTADGYEKLGDFASDTEYILKNVVLTVNGKYEFVLKDTGYTWSDNGVYRLDLGNIYYQAESISHTSKDGKATLKYDGSFIALYVLNDSDSPEKPGGDDVQKPEKVKTEISSVKMVFDYEKTGQNVATSLKVCGTEVNGFNGDGSYEVEIAESAWSTWDKTGFYNLGFIASDTEYALKNVTLTVNGKYEFILGETKTSEYNEAEKTYKVDFPNMWDSYSEGDVLFTSKDGKADIVSGGKNVVMSLFVESDSTSTPTPTPTPTPAPTKKPSRPSYVIPTATPTIEPTASPTIAPTATPTAVPTVTPTVTPTAVPTIKPTVAPTATPASTIAPTVAPTIEPTTEPTVKPTEAPVIPTKAPAEASKVQKGDKVTVSGQKYVVTNASQKTVSYVAPKNRKKMVVSVPATVKVEVNGKNVTYKVTSIQEKAFKGNKKLKKITVNKNIKSIGKDAFKNCSNLKTIVIKSSSITKVGKDALKGTAKNLVIKVPAKKVSAYKKLFKNKGNSSIVIKKI